MSRAHLTYNERREPVQAVGFNPDVPIAGLYRMSLVSKGVPVGVKIWHGPPHDPVTGEELDRGWRWQATANGRPVDLERAWPKCADAPIDQAEHDYLTSLQDWGEAHAPSSPQANPKRAVDFLRAPLVL